MDLNSYQSRDLGHIKNELVHNHNYKIREEAKADMTKYIELFL